MSDVADLPLFDQRWRVVDGVKDRLEATRGDVLSLLRGEAARLADENGTVSVNDLRPFFLSLGYNGDPRILGVVFRDPQWKKVGEEMGNSVTSHIGRTVQRYRLEGAA